MAKPVYIICADGVVEDRTSNRITIFNIIPKVSAQRAVNTVAGGTPGPSPTTASNFNAVVLSVWRLEESDRGHEFENEFAIQSEDGEHEFCMQVPHIKVPADKPKSLQRVKIELNGLPPFKIPGVWLLTNRIRKVDVSDEWVSQSYPLFVEGDPAFFEEMQAGHFAFGAGPLPVPVDSDQVGVLQSPPDNP